MANVRNLKFPALPAWLTPGLVEVIAKATAEFVKFMIALIKKRMAGEEIGDDALTFRLRGTLKQRTLWEAAKAAREK